MTARDFLARFHGVTGRGPSWKARCPAHEDTTPSLTVTETPDKLLLHCHAGCTAEQIVTALDLTLADLFLDPPSANGGRWTQGDADTALANRGLRPATITHFQIVADLDKGAWRFPVGLRDHYKMKRGSPGEPKYWWAPSKPKDPAAEVYNLKACQDAPVAYLLEGEPDVWIAHQAGIPAFTFTGGAATVKPEAVELVKAAHIGCVRVVYDRDQAGVAGMQAVHTAFTTAGIAYDLRKLPASVGVGGDVTTLYNNLSRDDAAFRAALEGLPVLRPTTTTSTARVIAADAFMANTTAADDDEEWFVPGVVGRGIVTGITAKPKQGKSTFALHAAVALAEGQGFLGHYAPRPLRVLWLNLEMTERLLRKKLRALVGTAPPAGLLLATGTRTDFGVARVAQLVAEHQVDLLIVDSLSKWWEVREENDNVENEREMTAILAMARERGTGVLLIHHAPKGTTGAESPSDLFRGGGAIGAALDVALAYSKVKDADERTRKVTCESRYDESPDHLYVKLGTITFEKISSPVAQRHDEERAQVFKVLDVTPQTLANVVARLAVRGIELKDKAVRQRLEQLVEQRRAGLGPKEGNAYTYVRA